MHVQDILCNVVERIESLKFWPCDPDKGAFHTYVTEKIYKVYVKQSIIYTYKRMYEYAPLLEATTHTVFIVWLRVCISQEVCQLYTIRTLAATNVV
jgi:hypothetical protein